MKLEKEVFACLRAGDFDSFVAYYKNIFYELEDLLKSEKTSLNHYCRVRQKTIDFEKLGRLYRELTLKIDKQRRFKNEV
jgi:hypothetical protein